MQKLNTHMRIGLLIGVVFMTLNGLIESAPLVKFIKGMCVGLSIVFIISGIRHERKSKLDLT